MNRVLSISSTLRYALVATALLVAANGFAVQAQTTPRIFDAKVDVAAGGFGGRGRAHCLGPAA